MKVKFLPQNIEVEAGPNKSVLQVATENNLEIRSICKGVPSCAECRVRIVEGEQNVLPPSKAELNLIGTSYYIDSRRLSCQLRCFGDVTVDLTEQVEKAANQVKKIRGFRSSKQIQSHAVNDTMLLNEKIDVNEPQRPEEKPEQEKPQGGGGQQRQQNQPRQQRQQQAKGGGGQNQQRQQQQQKPKQQGQGGQQGQQQGKQQNRSQQPRQQQPQQPRPLNQNQKPPQQNQQKQGPPKPKDS